MNKIWFFSLFILSGFLIASLVINVLLVRNRFDSQLHGGNFRQVRGELKAIINPKNDFINIVIITLKNPGLINKDQYKLEVQDEKGSVIREMNFSGFNVGDPSDLKFQFSPIENSKNKKFMIVLKEKAPSNSPIFVDSSKEGGFAYRLYYKSINKRAVMSNFLIEWKNKLFNNLNFFILWSILLSTLIWKGTQNEKN